MSAGADGPRTASGYEPPNDPAEDWEFEARGADGPRTAEVFGSIDDLRATLTRNGLDGFLPALDHVEAERDGLKLAIEGLDRLQLRLHRERDAAMQEIVEQGMKLDRYRAALEAWSKLRGLSVWAKRIEELRAVVTKHGGHDELFTLRLILDTIDEMPEVS